MGREERKRKGRQGTEDITGRELSLGEEGDICYRQAPYSMMILKQKFSLVRPSLGNMSLPYRTNGLKMLSISRKHFKLNYSVLLCLYL